MTVFDRKSLITRTISHVLKLYLTYQCNISWFIYIWLYKVKGLRSRSRTWGLCRMLKFLIIATFFSNMEIKIPLKVTHCDGQYIAYIQLWIIIMVCWSERMRNRKWRHKNANTWSYVARIDIVTYPNSSYDADSNDICFKSIRLILSTWRPFQISLYIPLYGLRSH